MTRPKRWQVRAFFVLWLLFLWLMVKAPFEFLVLNTFLGYIPIEISFHIDKRLFHNVFLFWILIIIWLLFYPNSPYMLTDLFHLSLLQPYAADGLLRLSIHMWAYFGCMLISALFCAFLGMWSLSHVSDVINARYFRSNKWMRWLIIFVLTALTSVGIFIGRFLRIHTIYLITSPGFILSRLSTMWTPKMFAFVAIMTVVQLIIFWFYSLVTTQKSPQS
ncbi:DUF1361 domain-containing protein [Secundilactobacillus oryzae]|uniref:DUF1361 domain-containing protein n=2 Tax=Secundilactobacillus oryzae TaxID=1202668 RepID=UPI000A7A71B7|nr:DUF1361 domain-containing protein [Secundilactobacillus oryzae]